MSTPALELFAKLGLDSSEYDLGLKNAKGDAEGFAFSFSEAFKTVAKVGVAAFTAVGTAITAITKQSVSAYAEYEQLWGGVQKLYGDGADALRDYAEQAFMTSGMSVNQYMETATQFSASLIKSLEGDMDEATRLTDVAMRAMSDNVNVFGTDMEAVSNAFKGLSRNNYTMIDNLKLGYAGTAQGMLELINDSGVLEETLEDTSQLATVGFAKMVEAIQAVQEAQGIAGTTAKEAMFTIQGSANATRAAWQNVITAIGKGEGVSDAISGLMTALMGDEEGGGLINNVIPRIKTTMEAVGDAIVEFAPFIVEKIPEVFDMVVPTLFKATTGLISSLISLIKERVPAILETGIEFIQEFSKGLVDGIPQLLSNVLPIVESMTKKFHDFVGLMVDTGLDMLVNFVQGLMNAMPELIAYVPQIVINIADTINDNMPKILATAWTIIKTIIKGIVDSIPALIENSGKIIDAIWATVSAVNWLNLGKNVLTFIIDGLKNMIPQLAKSAGDARLKLLDGFTKIDWISIGKNIIKGIGSGILSMGSWLLDQAVGVARSAFNGIKKFLGIQSPSKLMKEQIGKYMALGFGEGFEDYIPVKDMVGAVKKTVDEMKDVNFEAFDEGLIKREGDIMNNSNVSSVGNIIINVYGEDKSVKQIAQEVSDIIQYETTVLRRVYR